jgi:predicted nuclease with TOPRIM domain
MKGCEDRRKRFRETGAYCSQLEEQVEEQTASNQALIDSLQMLTDHMTRLQKLVDSKTDQLTMLEQRHHSLQSESSRETAKLLQ